MKIITDMTVRLEELDLARAMGYRPHASIKPEIQARMDALTSRAAGLCAPRGVYKIFEAGGIPEAVPLQSSAMVGLAVCTIGNELEELASALYGEGDMLDAFICDALGSEAVEETAGLLDRIIAQDPRTRGLYPGRRISPGYGAWDLTSQKAIFRLVPAEPIGVTLTESYMMVPRKSISFALPFAAAPDDDREKGNCSVCEQEDCPFRKETG